MSTEHETIEQKRKWAETVRQCSVATEEQREAFQEGMRQSLTLIREGQLDYGGPDMDNRKAKVVMDNWASWQLGIIKGLLWALNAIRNLVPKEVLKQYMGDVITQEMTPEKAEELVQHPAWKNVGR